MATRAKNRNIFLTVSYLLNHRPIHLMSQDSGGQSRALLFYDFLSSADLFQNYLFPRILTGILSESQLVWIQVMTDRILRERQS